MLEAWSRTRDGTRKLSANFTVAEFACKDGSDPVFVDSSLAALLQKIRDHFGRPVVITSGYRTAAHNAAVGGSKSSQHLLGRAADIQVQDTDPLAVAAYAESLMPGWGGVGLWLIWFLLANLPFILIQRYNRPRLMRLHVLLQRREQRKGTHEHSDTDL